MKTGKIATCFLYFVTKTWKIQFVLSFLRSIALGGTSTVFQDYFPIYLVFVFFRTFFQFWISWVGFKTWAKQSLRDKLQGMSWKIDWIGRSAEGTRRFKRSPRDGDGGALKSQLSSVDIDLLIQQNLDGSVLVIYNTPCNTPIVIKAKLRFSYVVPQSERSENEEGMEKKIKSRGRRGGEGDDGRATLQPFSHKQWKSNNENKYCIRLNVFIEWLSTYRYFSLTVLDILHMNCCLGIQILL